MGVFLFRAKLAALIILGWRPATPESSTMLFSVEALGYMVSVNLERGVENQSIMPM